MSGCSKMFLLTPSNACLSSVDLTAFPAIQYLDLSGNQLTALDVSANTDLVQFSCENNPLTALDVSKCTNLQLLRFAGTQVKEISLIKNTKLGNLRVGGSLSYLDLGKNTKLDTLEIYGTNIASFDSIVQSSTASLLTLTLNTTKINAVPARYTALTTLTLTDNAYLSTVDLSKSTALNSVYLENNRSLTAVDFSKNTALKKFYCYNSFFPSLDLGKQTLTSTKIEGTKLTALKANFTCGMQNASVDFRVINGYIESVSNGYWITQSAADACCTMYLRPYPGYQTTTIQTSCISGFDYDREKRNSAQGDIVFEALAEGQNDVAQLRSFLDVKDGSGISTGSKTSVSYQSAQSSTWDNIHFKHARLYRLLYGKEESVSEAEKLIGRLQLQDDTLALDEIQLANNAVDELSLHVNGITTLTAPNNKLHKVDLGASQVSYLDLSNNLLTELTVGPRVATCLQTIHVQNNRLTSLDASTSDVSYLDCSNNAITQLKLPEGQVFSEFDVSNNRLSGTLSVVLNGANGQFMRANTLGNLLNDVCYIRNDNRMHVSATEGGAVGMKYGLSFNDDSADDFLTLEAYECTGCFLGWYIDGKLYSEETRITLPITDTLEAEAKFIALSDEQLALRTFFEQSSSAGSNGTKLFGTGYMANDPESWSGVGMENGRVTALQFSASKALTGTLDLTGFDALCSLDITNCKLSALTLCGCSSLQTLLADGNKLTTLDLTDCNGLTKLTISGNPLIDFAAHPEAAGYGSIHLTAQEGGRLNVAFDAAEDLFTAAAVANANAEFLSWTINGEEAAYAQTDLAIAAATDKNAVAAFRILFLYGDADCNNAVNAGDAAAILRSTVKILPLTEDGLRNADVDGQPGVNAADAACILRYTVKLLSALPVGD